MTYESNPADWLYIESDANPRFKRWKRLALEARAVKRERATLLEGLHLLGVVLEHPEAKVSAVMLSDVASEEAQALARMLAEKTGARLYGLAARLYDQISPVENGVGCMCELALPEAPQPETWAEADVLYLDGVQDAGNVGTLIRTAVAAGFRTIVANVGTASMWSPKVMRAGMGAHLAARLIENLPPEKLRATYRGRIYAADARGGEDIFAATDYANGPCCWVMGAEGPGVSEAALAVADARYYIPIESTVESLNVGAAAAVCLFEARRRRLLKTRQSSSK